MIYNIAVFGSCASRDNFYSGINPDYKKYFNCSISSQRGSIISLMQEPVSFKNQDIQILPENRVNKAGTQFINQDLTKNFLAEVKKFKPDYILIDNYFEVIFGIIKYENCFITNNYWDLPKTKFHTEIKPYTKINMYNDPNTYLKLYKENMNLFLDYIQKESPNSQIILNPVRLGYKILKDDNNIEVNKNLDELCHSLFKYYFIDFIPFCDDDFIDSDIGEIPKEWSITTVGNILDCKLGGTPSRSNESYWGGSIAWINSGKVNDFRIIEPSEYITEKGLKKSATKLLPAKTTVIAITGATLGQISLLEIDSCANQSVIGIIPNINYPYEFVYPLISSILIDLLKHQTGGAQQHINKNNVESFKIICPPAEIISEYKTIVSPIYSKISDNCFEIEKLQKLRDTLLPKLMSGEIDVSKINCDLELKYNYMKYLFNQIHTPMSKSVV